MAFPKISTINNVYIGSTLNTQWNANGGTFGTDPANSNLPFVGATSTPSFFGAGNFDASSSSFSALVAPAPAGNGTVQTSLLIKADENNFVEMFVGPGGSLGGYVANDAVPRLPTNPFPTYNSTTHAYWRIRNDSFQFFFETSPNGTTWTTLNSVTYDWDVTQVTVMFLAGFTGTESSQTKAYISNVNGNVVSTSISGSVGGIGSANGIDKVTIPLLLNGVVNGFSGTGSRLSILSTIPEGGLTDFSVSGTASNDRDPTSAAVLAYSTPNIAGGASRTWARPYISTSALSAYRNQEFWTKSNGAWLDVGAEAPDTNMAAFTNVQLEKTIGQGNRLSTNAAYYTQTCEYVAQQSLTPSMTGGSISVTRSSDRALSGNYSGKIVYGGDTSGQENDYAAYWIYPTQKALVPVVTNAAGRESLRGTISLSSDRAGTKWSPVVVIYDANFNIINNPFQQSSGPSNAKATHPGGGVWQTASVLTGVVPVGSAWAAVVPYVFVDSQAPETVYVSGHSIIGITPEISSYPTAYVDPQQLTVELKADRVNLAKNSGFISTLDGWGTARSAIVQTSLISDTFARTAVSTGNDTFTRTVVNGWGNADTGQAWTGSGLVTASEANVNAGQGTLNLTTINSPRFETLGLNYLNPDVTVTTTSPIVSTGSAVSTSVRLRAVDSNNYYHVEQLRQTNGTLQIQLVARVGGVTTIVAGPVTVGNYTANQPWKLRAKMVGTVLQGKSWPANQSEPDKWQLEVINSSISVSAPVGVRTSSGSAIPLLISFDNFSATEVPVGWGTSSSGQAWSTSGGVAEDFNVTNDRGYMELSTVNVSRKAVIGSGITDAVVTSRASLPALVTGSLVEYSTLARFVDDNNYYTATLNFNTDNSVDLLLRKVVAGVATTLNTVNVATNITSPFNTTGVSYITEFKIQGTTLQAKAWLASSPEPANYQVLATDSTFTTGSVGVRGFLNFGNTNALPFTVAWDDFSYVNPNANPQPTPSTFDEFSRVTANGWGTAPSGGTWVVFGTTSDYATNGATASQQLSVANTPRTSTLVQPSSDMDEQMEVFINSAAVTGASVYTSLVSRYVDDNNNYRAVIEITTAGNVNLTLRKTVAGTTTILATKNNILTAGFTSDYYTLRFQNIGSAIRAKFWKASAPNAVPEPALWTLQATDTSITAANRYGIRSTSDAGNTNVNYNFIFNNFLANAYNTSIAWDGATGYNSLGSMQVSYGNMPNFTGIGASVSGATSILQLLSSTRFPVVAQLEIGNAYTFSAYIKQGVNCPDVTMHVVDGNYREYLNVSLNTLKSQDPSVIVGNGWVRIYGSFTVPPDGSSDYRLWFTCNSADVTSLAPFSFWVDSILVEKGSQVFSYFDGNFSSPDYQFEKQSTNSDNRSYYYKDFTNKLSRVNRIIPQVAPLGTTANVISAQSP